MNDRLELLKAYASTDDFCELPAESQTLFFHLFLNADDKGTVQNSSFIKRGLNIKSEFMNKLIDEFYLETDVKGNIVIVGLYDLLEMQK